MAIRRTSRRNRNAYHAVRRCQIEGRGLSCNVPLESTEDIEVSGRLTTSRTRTSFPGAPLTVDIGLMEILPYTQSSPPTDKATCDAVVVVPCYNEADRLPVVEFRAFAKRQVGIRFVFVNDGSSDNTADLLADLATSDSKHFEFLDLPCNSGKAEAIRQGLLYSLQSSPSAIGFWDADLSTRLEPIPDFCRVLDRHTHVEMVIGTRLALLGRQINRKPARRLLGRVFATVASIALGLRICDTQCGAKLFRVTPELTQVFSDPFLAKWIFDVEVIARYLQLRRQLPPEIARDFIYEHPIDSWEEVGGSRLKSHDFATAIVDLTRIYWKYLRPGAAWSSSQPACDNAVATISAVSTIPIAQPVDDSQPSRRAA